MTPGKLLFDLAGMAALVYLACGPGAQSAVEQPAPARMAVADRPEESAPRPIRRAEDGLFYVWAEVNGTPVRFLVDTGASVVVLTPGDAHRAGVSIRRGASAGRIETAAGASRMRWAQLESINIAGRELRDLDAAVVGRGLRVSLLGQNLLTKLDGVSIDGNHLRLQ